MPMDVTSSVAKWSFQNSHVERNMDNAAYTAAHPDDTLVMAGPARKSMLSEANGGSTSSSPATLLPIGMVQQLSWQQSKPTQPMMALGSGRSFFTSGKAQTSWSAGRLWVNGRSMLRVLYHNAVEAGIEVEKFDDPAAISRQAKHFINLDSELYYIPFGMAVVFRSKAHDWLGSFYAELCMINSWSTSVMAGQNQIMEQVSGVADRILPQKLSQYGVSGKVPRATVDKLIGFTSAATQDDARSTTVTSIQTT